MAPNQSFSDDINVSSTSSVLFLEDEPDNTLNQQDLSPSEVPELQTLQPETNTKTIKGKDISLESDFNGKNKKVVPNTIFQISLKTSK